MLTGEKNMPKNPLSIKNQTIISSLGMTVQFFAQWLISVLLVRMDGYEAAGVFSLAMSISNVFAYFANYGLRNYQITDVKHSFTKRQYLLARFELICVGFIGCAVYLLCGNGYTVQEKWAILLYLLYNLINGVGDTLLGFVQVQNHLETSGYSCATKGFFCFIAFIGTFLITHNIVAALAAMAVASLAVVLTYDCKVYRCYVPKSAPAKPFECKRSWLLWKACFTLMLSQVVPILTTAIPRRTIQTLLGVESLGVFSSIFTPTVVISTLAPAVVTAVLPAIATHWQAGRFEQVRHIMASGVVVFAGITALAVATVFLIGRPVMVLLFGKSILANFSLLYWAVLATICSTLASFFNGILTAARHTGSIAALTVVALVLTAVLSAPFVQAFGIYGAAYVQLLVYLVQVAIQILLTIKFTHSRS